MEIADRYFDYKCSNGMEQVWNARQCIRYLKRDMAYRTEELMDVSNQNRALLALNQKELWQALVNEIPEIKWCREPNGAVDVEFVGDHRQKKHYFNWLIFQYVKDRYSDYREIEYYKKNPWEHSVACNVKSFTYRSHDYEQAEIVMDALFGEATRRAEIRWNKKHTDGNKILDQDEAISLKSHGWGLADDYETLYLQAFAKDVERFGLDVPIDRADKARHALYNSDPQYRKDIKHAQLIKRYAFDMYDIHNSDATASDKKTAQQDLAKIE